MILLRGGRIIASGTASQLKGSLGGSTIYVHDDAGHIRHQVPTSGAPQDVAEHLRSLSHQWPDATVTVRRPSLDEVFLELTDGPAAPDTAQPAPKAGARA